MLRNGGRESGSRAAELQIRERPRFLGINAYSSNPDLALSLSPNVYVLPRDGVFIQSFLSLPYSYFRYLTIALSHFNPPSNAAQ